MLLTLNEALKPLPMQCRSQDSLVAALEERQTKYGDGVRITHRTYERCGDWSRQLPSEHCHAGIGEYLSHCYGAHRGIVISPDLLWQLLSSSLAQAVKAEPETYRYLFSETQEKQKIFIQADTHDVSYWLPAILEHLRKLVPMGIEDFLPRFSTTSEPAYLARQATLCDVVSPYYEYMVYCCGFPKIEVSGTLEDWSLFNDHLIRLTLAFEETEIVPFLQQVHTRTSSIQEELSAATPNVDFFREFYRWKRCGSGSQQEVRGWVRDFLWKPGRDLLEDHFNSGLGNVAFRNLSEQKDYRLSAGVLGSTERSDGIREPRFGYVIMHKPEQPQLMSVADGLHVQPELITVQP